MKTRTLRLCSTQVFAVCLLAVGLILGLTWVLARTAVAQAPAPPSDKPVLKPFPRPASLPTGASVQDVTLGEPGLSFRYVETFGETEVAYITDTLHLNFPYGIGTDDNSVWIGEQWGNRILKYDNAGNFQMQLGCARAPYACPEDTAFREIVDVARDGGGNIWVVDVSRNQVLKLDSSGHTLLELGEKWVEGSDNSHFMDPISVAFDAGGNIYVSDGAPFWNRGRGNHRIQIFQSDGTYLATIGQTGVCGSGNNQLCGPRHIAIYGDELYVADAGNDRVQIFDITNPASPTYVATIDGLNNPSGVAVDANYIYVADTWNNQVQVFNRSTRAHVATIGTGWGTGNDQFKNPTDVAVDAAGNLYVADWVNTRVQQFIRSGNTWTYVRTYGVTGIPYVTDGYHYNSPSGVAVAGDGSIYLTEDYGHRLVKLSPDGTPIWTVGAAGVKGDWDYSNDRLNNPDDVALDAGGRVYVADRWHNRVQSYNPDGSYYATVGDLDCPGGVAIGPNGYLYVADSCNHTVKIYDTNLALVATLGTPGEAGTDNAHFNGPEDVAVDSGGTIYVSDRDNHRVQVFNANYAYVRTMGETGVSGGDFNHFNGPNGLFVDANDRLYVADKWNNRIQVFDKNGNYLTTIGGSWGSRSGEFRGAHGIAVDSAGNVYVADYDNHRIQKFAPGVPGWKQVNINGFGERRNSWISSLVSFKGHLYASGYQAYVWRLETDGAWSAVNTLGFGDSTNVEIDAMAVFNNSLYAATFTFLCDDPDCNTWHTNGPQFWRTADGTTWENVTPPGSIGSDYRWVPTMMASGGYLYAALDRGDQNTLGAEIWRTSNGQNWERIASGGFDDPYNTGVLSLVEYNGYLYAGTRHGDWQDDAHPDGPLGGEVWRYDGSNWVQVNDPGFGDAEAHRVERLIVFNNALYAYISRVGGTSKGAEVWRCAATVCNSQSDWVKVVDNGFGNPANQYIFSGITFGDYLYAAVANWSVGLQLWRTGNGTDWEPVAEAGLGDSNNAYIWLNAMAVHNNRLYIGTTNGANGGEVWKKTVTADFTANPTVGTPGTTVTFTNLSGGDVITATWDFGDGSALLVSSATTVTHTYTTPGVYTVTLIVQDGVDTDVRTRSAYIRIAHFIYLPLVMRNYNPLMALYDDFNNPAFDGFYNLIKWQFWGDSTYFDMHQENGVMRLTSTNAPAERDTVLVASAPLERTLREVQRFRARLKISPDTNGTGAKIQIVAEDIGAVGRNWWASCDLTKYGSDAYLGCSISSSTGGEYHIGGPAEVDRWYTMRIEVDPNTARFCFYQDDSLLGCHTPNDAAALKAVNSFTARIGAWNEEANPTGMLYFDDVYLTPGR